MVLQVAGGLIVAFYVLRILITAFKESVLQGVLCIILPPFYYVSRGGIAWRGCVILMVGGRCRRGAWLPPDLVGADVQAGEQEMKREAAACCDLQQRPAIVMVCRDTAMI